MSGNNPTDPSDLSPKETAGFFRRHLRTPREALQPDEAPPPPPPPPRPSKRNPRLGAISGFLSFLLVLCVGIVGLFAYGHQQLLAPGPLTSDKVVMIAPRTEVPDIVSQLEYEGIISNSFLLNVTLVLEGSRSRVKAGEYLFKQQASLRDVIDTLVSGKQLLHSITIPEGLTSEQIVQRLRENELLSGDVRDIPKEGTLLPETYRVARGMSRNDLLAKMQSDHKRIVDQIWARRTGDLPLTTPYELITLASIVEKETGRADERTRVAGVFINRLNKRMRLQSDPTIVYGLVGGKGTLGRGILRSEVDRPTAYNTYQIEGLPPGPIANPGRAAMEAVANPSRTRDLYFVADGTGGHAFAETLDQHNRNVTRWRQIERDRAATPATPNATPVDRVEPDASSTTPATPRERRGDLPPASSGGGSDVVVATDPPKDTTSLFGLAPELDKSLVTNFPAPRNALDGPMDSEQVDPNTYPVPSQMRTDQKARAQRNGMSAGDDDLPVGAADLRGTGAPRVTRIYDASEGTSLDPLRNKRWDLNSPHMVPDDLKPEQPAKATGSQPRKQATTQAQAPKPQAQAKPATEAQAKPAAQPKPKKPAPKPKPAPAAEDEE
jgi:UPF0755 protein